jgi:PIN domain nuclease of toxin-antitoxin system
MELPDITIDTHALIWYVDANLNYKLSEVALQTITFAEKNGTIYVPSIALMEAMDLIEKGKVSLVFNELLNMVDRGQNYKIVPLDARLLRTSIPLKGLDIHDRLIVSTALLTNTVLISRDRTITEFGINVLW